MVQIGVIGLGYWGPNIVKSFELTGKAVVRWLCDLNAVRLEKIASKYPQADTTSKVEKILEDETVCAVVISTPAASHYEIARRALEAGKHVFIEKPIATSSEQALQLIHLAQTQQKTLMVGHVFEYNSTVQALKDVIDSGELGEIYYLSFERTNLGPVRTDVNALWDLASHDVSIMCYLLDTAPIGVTAQGQVFLNAGIEDTVFATFAFAKDILSHVHVSWINPRKVRQIVVVGCKKMAVWNDLDLQYPLRIYDRRITEPPKNNDTFLAYKTAVVDGGVYIPHLQLNQPLQAECEHFIECIEQGAPPQSGGYSGLRVVLALEAAMASMKNDSRITPITVPKQDTLSMR